MDVQIVLFDGFDPLDVIAPFEVLAAGSDLAGGDLTVRLVTAAGGDARPELPLRVVSGTRGLALEATATLDPSRPGCIVVPGVSGPLDQIPAMLGRVAGSPLPGLVAEAMTRPDVVVATQCGGALILAMAGLLTGRNAVTHVQGMGLLESTGARAIPARVVDDGDLVSSGGVTSGLDLGLHLVDRFLGPRIAHAVERLFEYERRGTVWRDAGRTPVPV
jgi:transcriptional regulator GlxA family with amidase domain